MPAKVKKEQQLRLLFFIESNLNKLQKAHQNMSSFTDKHSEYAELKTTTTQSSISLQELVANTCFCKLREQCPDKSSAECMAHRNIYAEFMLAKK
ncbi:MAG: hypothetical protein U1E13_14405 [Methylophilaceae bacterium]|nr:hypothetical protein [Methylophilaceae bacterium]